MDRHSVLFIEPFTKYLIVLRRAALLLIICISVMNIFKHFNEALSYKNTLKEMIASYVIKVMKQFPLFSDTSIIISKIIFR